MAHGAPGLVPKDLLQETPPLSQIQAGPAGPALTEEEAALWKDVPLEGPKSPEEPPPPAAPAADLSSFDSLTLGGSGKGEEPKKKPKKPAADEGEGRDLDIPLIS